jgi:hypothetical protein
LIFALLGPPIGLCFAMWFLLPVFELAVGDRPLLDWHQIAGRHVRYRPLWTALFGFAASFLPLLSSLTAGFIHGPIILLFGLVGAAPAALCSWLAGRLGGPQPSV